MKLASFSEIEKEMTRRPCGAGQTDTGRNWIGVSGSIYAPAARSSHFMSAVCQGRDQPLTAPAARPDASRRWTITKKISTGTVTRVELAMTGPQDVEFSPKNW